MAVSMRRVTTADQDFLRDLYAQTHGAALALAGLPAHQLSGLQELQFKAQQQQYLSLHPAARDHIVLRDDTAVGRCWVSESAGLLRVLDIAVLPAFQRQGIAEAVISQLQHDWAANVVRLSVWSENSAALALYRRCGFALPADRDARVPGYVELEFRRPLEARV